MTTTKVADRELTRATDYLAETDQVLASLLERGVDPDPFGTEPPVDPENRFGSLVLHIIGQQISTRVATVIFDRLETALDGPVSPQAVVRLGPEALRAYGMSRAKAGYITDLAERELDGRLDLATIHQLSDADALASLTAVHGIGLWSAQMFLLHQLHRVDIFPAGDVGLRKAVQSNWELSGVPTVKEVEYRAEGWSPYRSYAAALLWRSTLR